MYKVYDFECRNEECSKLNVPEEYFLDEKEHSVGIKCRNCQAKLVECMPAPKGYVKGTSNPVYFRTNKSKPEQKDILKHVYQRPGEHVFYKFDDSPTRR